MPYLANNKMLDLTYKKLKSLESPQIGYLKLNTYRHDTRSPISNAFVRVSKLTISGYYREIGTGVFLAANSSDENGSVPIFELPVLTNENEMYNVSVNYLDYCPAYIIDIPIYPGVTTTYDVYMHHYSMNGDVDMDYHLFCSRKYRAEIQDPKYFKSGVILSMCRKMSYNCKMTAAEALHILFGQLNEQKDFLTRLLIYP